VRFGYHPRMRRPVLACVVAVAAAVGCARLGYSSRVLHRVPSPDAQLVAVCQEVPIFDGPEFDVRLERPDGRVVRRLFHMGDGGGCSEMTWSPDGRFLAVLTSHVAGITIIDVGWALAHATEQNRHWFARGFGFSREGEFMQATSLRFVSASEVEFQLCEYSLAETQRNLGKISCSRPAHPKRLQIPTPLVPRQPA
jgi:hypothetical protein